MHRASQVGICTPSKPRLLAHRQIDDSSLNGGLSPRNCARKIPGPFMVRIGSNYVLDEGHAAHAFVDGWKVAPFFPQLLSEHPGFNTARKIPVVVREGFDESFGMSPRRARI